MMLGLDHYLWKLYGSPQSLSRTNVPRTSTTVIAVVAAKARTVKTASTTCSYAGSEGQGCDEELEFHFWLGESRVMRYYCS